VRAIIFLTKGVAADCDNSGQIVNAEFSEQSVADAIGTGLRLEARRKVADDRASKQHLGDGNVVNRVMLAL
jgi:hypothetical protein